MTRFSNSTMGEAPRGAKGRRRRFAVAATACAVVAGAVTVGGISMANAQDADKPNIEYAFTLVNQSSGLANMCVDDPNTPSGPACVDVGAGEEKFGSFFATIPDPAQPQLIPTVVDAAGQSFQGNPSAGTGAGSVLFKFCFDGSSVFEC